MLPAPQCLFLLPIPCDSSSWHSLPCVLPLGVQLSKVGDLNVVVVGWSQTVVLMNAQASSCSNGEFSQNLGQL